MKKYPLLLLSIWLLTGCDDKALVNIYNEKITQIPITCMKLQVVPQDDMIQTTLMKRYNFTDNCDLVLDVSSKSGIKCNSSYNAAQKTMGQFPNSYLKMELRRGMPLQYAYYIDLTSKPDEDDINRGFTRLEEDLNLVRFKRTVAK